VHGFEGNEEDLAREVRGFGTIVKIDVQRRLPVAQKQDLRGFTGSHAPRTPSVARGKRCVDPTSTKQTQKDIALRRKALRSCEGALFSALSERERERLADQSLLFSIDEGGEVTVQSAQVTFLFVVGAPAAPCFLD
jgi:hypothetical protein